MAKQASKMIPAANMVASMATLAMALDKNTGLVEAMNTLADAAETTAMGSLTVYRLLVDEDNGGLSPEQLAELPAPDTQGWDEKNPTVDGDYAGFSSNNPDWFKRPSLVPGVNKPAIVSAINLFSDGLKICRDWAEVIAQADKDKTAGIIGDDDYSLIEGKYQGRIDRMRTKVRGAIKLGQNMAAAEETPWDKVLRVEFAQSKEFERDKEGKYLRDKAGRPKYKLVDERTTQPIVIRALDDKGQVSATHFRTIEQFNALDFVGALEDTKDAPGGTLQALFATAQRGATGGKDSVSIANAKQAQSGIYALATFLPDAMPAIGKELDKGDQNAMEYLAAIRELRNNLAAMLAPPSRKKLLDAYDAAQDAAAKPAEQQATTPAKVA